tara:strand:- start:27533 stop:28792 length:1260 start_codon:yes stop_codon:yes gene_type:complete
MAVILSCSSDATQVLGSNPGSTQGLDLKTEVSPVSTVGGARNDKPSADPNKRVSPKDKQRHIIKPTFTPAPLINPTFTAPSSEPDVVKFVKNVRVTPDDNIDIIGAFCRINYVPKTENFLITFGGTSQVKGTQGYGYKWYTEQMEFTGEGGLFENRGTDTASVMIGDKYYFLTDGGKDMWALRKYDPIDWTLLGETLIPRDPNKEPGNDFMLEDVNGMLDVAGLYVAEAATAIDQHKLDPYEGEATSHRFFSEDLEFLDDRIFNDIPHINASSMVFVEGIYNFVTSTAFFGDLIVMQYDEDWNYLGSKPLTQWGNWPMGTVYDPGLELFFVSYISVENIINKSGFRNIRLGIFDREWDLKTDIAVTNYHRDSMTQSGRPSVIIKDDNVYVAYDVSTVSRDNLKENQDWECEINVYELVR